MEIQGKPNSSLASQRKPRWKQNNEVKAPIPVVNKKGEIPCAVTYGSLSNLIRYTKIYFLKVSLVFHRFSYLKKYEPFRYDRHFCIIEHRVRYFKTLFEYALKKSSFFRLNLITENKDAHPWHPFSSACQRYISPENESLTSDSWRWKIFKTSLGLSTLTTSLILEMKVGDSPKENICSFKI